MNVHDKIGIIICGMVCLTLVEMYALSRGINGTFLTLYVGVMTGAMGIMIPTPKRLK